MLGAGAHAYPYIDPLTEPFELTDTRADGNGASVTTDYMSEFWRFTRTVSVTQTENVDGDPEMVSHISASEGSLGLYSQGATTAEFELIYDLSDLVSSFLPGDFGMVAEFSLSPTGETEYVSVAAFLDDATLLAADIVASTKLFLSLGDGESLQGDEVLRLVITGPLGFSARVEPIDALIGMPSPVPEPAAITLFGLGLAGLARARQRRTANSRQMPDRAQSLNKLKAGGPDAAPPKAG